MLGIAALAGIATTASAPTADGYVDGALIISSGSTLTREVRIHLAPVGSGPTSGQLSVRLRSAAGFGPAYSGDIVVTIAPIDATPGSPHRSYADLEIPVESCSTGCDLAYLVSFTAADSVGPLAMLRYRADVSFQFGYGGSQEPAVLVIELVGTDGATEPFGWLVVLAVGVIGLILGMLAPSLQRLRGRTRLIPAFVTIGALAIVGFLPIGYLVYAVIASEVPLHFDEVLVLGPLSISLLVLPFAMFRGVRRWKTDHGWLLGLATVATITLGGLWFALAVASSGLLEIVRTSVVAAVGGLVLGTLLRQTWLAKDHGLAGLRMWPALAVVSQGLLISGLLAVAVPGLQPIPIVAAAVVLVGLVRWFARSPMMMGTLNAVLLVIGVLGTLLFVGVTRSGFLGADASSFVPLILIEVGAAAVGLITATRRFRTPTAASLAASQVSAADDPIADTPA